MSHQRQEGSPSSEEDSDNILNIITLAKLESSNQDLANAAEMKSVTNAKGDKDDSGPDVQYLRWDLIQGEPQKTTLLPPNSQLGGTQGLPPNCQLGGTDELILKDIMELISGEDILIDNPDTQQQSNSPELGGVASALHNNQQRGSTRTTNGSFLWQKEGKCPDPAEEKRRQNSIKARRNRERKKQETDELGNTLKRALDEIKTLQAQLKEEEQKNEYLLKENQQQRDVMQLYNQLFANTATNVVCLEPVPTNTSQVLLHNTPLECVQTIPTPQECAHNTPTSQECAHNTPTLQECAHNTPTLQECAHNTPTLQECAAHLIASA